MLKLRPIQIICMAIATLACAKTFAHHGWRAYSEDFTMTAKVVEVKFGNPHDQIIIEDGNAEQWHFLLAPPARNRRFGFDESVVAVGDVVDLVGQHSTSINEGKVHLIKNQAGETIYTYYYDRGETSLERQRR
ncbi:MAG: hypothetical protein KTR16_16680 [Acidiferrobacterales bacterium]|nr:hypothetical protein [Acidiferrobacterales bacterium]